MADLVAKFNVIAQWELRPNEAVLAAFRTRARPAITFAGDLAPGSFHPRLGVSPTAQAGWPVTRSDRGNLIGVTSSRILISELPNLSRRTYHVNEVPLQWVVGAATAPGSDGSAGTTPVSLELSNGTNVLLYAVTRDQPDRFVAVVRRVLERR